MNYYVYMMIVTLDLKLTQIYKNAAIFAFLGIVKNIVITVVLVLALLIAVYIGIYTRVYILLMPIAILYIGGIMFSFLSYTASFLTFPTIKKYILDPYYKDHPEHSLVSVENGNTSDVAADTPVNDADETGELPEFIYQNGKLVHRSVLENKSIFEDDINK